METIKQKECKHDFREFFKTRFGMLKLKEVKCIYCGKLKKLWIDKTQ